MLRSMFGKMFRRNRSAVMSLPERGFDTQCDFFLSRALSARCGGA